MNELGIRKLPRDDDGVDPERDTTDDDSDFEEGYRKKNKPIMEKSRVSLWIIYINLRAIMIPFSWPESNGRAMTR